MTDTPSVLTLTGQGREVFPALVRTMLTVGAQSPKEVRPFSNGLAAFYDMEKRRYGFFDKAGKIIVRPST